MSLLAACMCWFVRVSLCGVGMKERGRRGACSLNTESFPVPLQWEGRRDEEFMWVLLRAGVYCTVYSASQSLPILLPLTPSVVPVILTPRRE